MLSVIVSVAGVAVVVAALIWWGNHQMRVVLHSLKEIQPPATPSEAPLVRRLEELEGKIHDLFQAVADGIDHVDRNEKRVRGIVHGAKRRFEASEYFDPGVDAEADTLPDHDASEERGERLLPLQDDVAPDIDRAAWAVVPGRIS
jgi:hypothetical protein